MLGSAGPDMPAFYLITFGCQMNEHDSRRIADSLLGAGYHEVSSPELADLVLLNTCSVREKAEQKLRSEVGRIAMLKRERPSLAIVVAGCVGQQEGAKLLRSAPDIDLVIGPDNIPELPGLLRELEHGAPPRAFTQFDLEQPRFLPALTRPGAEGPSAYVTVMKGCNERCSFCIVPYTRGAERYRPSREILDEIEQFVAAGVVEITLLGQTVNSYRDPSQSLATLPKTEADWVFTPRAHARDDESEFPALLHAVMARVPSLKRLRYTSPHPRHMTPALIAAHRELPALVRHVHLPVQSGSNALLRRMIRRYSVEEYLERIAALRQAVPGLTLSTDMIVGFPGETEQDHAASLKLVEQLRFVGIFGFKYSPRPGTPSLKLGDDVPEATKSRRLEELFQLGDRIRHEHYDQLVGSTELVLVDGRSRDGAAYTGRTERNEIVHFAAKANVIGQLQAMRIAAAFRNSLAGELLDPALSLPATELARLSTSTVHKPAQAVLPESLGQHPTEPLRRQLPVL